MTIRGIVSITTLALALASGAAAQEKPRVPRAPRVPAVKVDREDALYNQGRNAIEQNRYERAVESFDRVIDMKSRLTDASMYWKAYSLSKMARLADALSTLGELQKQFADSRWIKDARALEVELRQAAGQPVTADVQNDEELKLLALRGLMQSNPDTTLPIIEKMLAGNDTPRVKERALFVLSQSGSPRAREIIVTAARGNANPDLQLAAIRYLGMMGGAQGRQSLDEIYRASSDVTVKRAILRGYMISGARDRILAVARTEAAPELRAEAVQQLGALGAATELEELYRAESSVDVKRRILQALGMTGKSDVVINLAKNEADPDLRRLAIRNLGMNRNASSTEALLAIYGSAGSDDIRRAAVEALFMHGDAKSLVDLARNEKSAEMRKVIVQRLSMMRSPEATAYLMELLK
jgi:HEAT repeat protein